MGRKFLAALLAAVSIVPSAAIAQDRGERGDRGRSGGERAQQRGNGGGWQSRPGMQQPQPQRPQPQRSQAQRPQPQAQVPQAPQASAGWQQRQRAEQGVQSGGWQQRNAPRAQAQSGGWNNQQRTRPQQSRGDDRQYAPGVRPVAPSGQVTREGYRVDRDRNGAALQRDRQQDRRADGQRNWSRNSAVDRNDQRRWDGNRPVRNDQRGWNNGRWNDNSRYAGGWNQNRNDRGHWNRDWRRDSRYDWNSWRGSKRNAFRLPRYYAPYGWNTGYRQFGIGAVISSMLFAQDYWIDDPYSYRLPEADGQYRWVRYYNDALLVDVYCGEVVDVVNNIFW